MLAGIEAWVRSLIWISFFIALVELAIPSGSFKGYVRLSLGLVLVTAVLRPLVHLLPAQPPSLPAFSGGQGKTIAAGQQLYRHNQALVLQDYQSLLSQEVVRVAGGAAGGKALAEVSVANNAQASAFGSVQAVRITLVGATVRQAATKVRSAVAAYLDVPTNRITVSGG